MRIYENEPMSAHTTFKVGGPAARFMEPESIPELEALVAELRAAGTPFAVVGRGSNLLVGDVGYAGVVIHIGDGLAKVTVEDTELIAEAGVSLSTLARTALNEGLSGLEFAAGIPGSLGGALIMNAGAYGGEMCQVATEETILDRAGKIRRIPIGEMGLRYRGSRAADEGWIVLGCRLRLQPGDPEQIRATMEDLAKRRRDKQPLEYPSAGSTFKRPEGHFAGKLIEDAGLKGFSVGGAQVSEKHAGFVINRGGATAADILALCGQVSEKVREQFGVELEMEVKKLGEF